MTSLGLGLAAIGRPDYINIRATKPLDKSKAAFKEKALEVLDEAYNLGIRHFDVAASYGYGEQFLLDWMSSCENKDISISTKWGYTYAANWEIGYSGKHEIKEHSLNKLNEQWQFSKQFLPQLNIYQIHSATLDSGVLSNTDVHNRLFELKQNYGFNIGISTSGANQAEIIDAAMSIYVDGQSLIDSYQVTFNILEQSTLKTLRRLRANSKIIIIKEALANGRIFPWYKSERYSEIYNLLKQLSDGYKVGIDAIALRYVIDKVEPNWVLSGASNVNQLRSNMDCLKIELPLEAIEILSKLSCNSNAYWTERSNLTWH
jgi:aryl-alcohol dehydrogenase-like predicted oxidoreductase